MKISAQQKERVRATIERSAERLFRKHGFNAATTRQIATAAGVATGTVFNYFPTKDDLGLALLRHAFELANQDFQDHRRGDESLPEDLFAYLWSCFKRLKPNRAFAGEVLQRTAAFGTATSDTVTSQRGEGRSPIPAKGNRSPQSAEASLGDASTTLTRSGFLRPIDEILKRHGIVPSVLDQHLFTALWLGIAGFWSRDKSANQEDSMVVLDRSMHLFADHLSSATREPK
ncbi:MAG TPA: TetR/AcrR family transcriptional regulator [Blastocatellia bacterium]